MAQHLHGLLARGSRAEVAPAEHDVAGPHRGGEGGIDLFHAMAGDLVDAELHVGPWREQVGIDVVAEYPGATGILRSALIHASLSRGSAIRPAIADAATV